MGMRYTTLFDGVAVTVAQDFFELTVPSDAAVIIHEVHIGQGTEEADAQAEMLRILLKRGIGATSGSGGSTHTPAKLETGQAAAGSTVEINNTTAATAGGGSLTTFKADAFNVQIGWHYVPTPESRPVLSPSEILVVNLPDAPADSITFSGYIVFEEIGG